MLFRLSTLELALLLFAVVLGSSLLGVVAGRRLRHHSETCASRSACCRRRCSGSSGSSSRSASSMAVGRYEARRAAVVDDANAIGTTYLRAQTLQEPMRTRSLDAPARYTDTSIRAVERRAGQRRRERAIARRASGCSGSSGGSPARRSTARPTDSAPRLYVDSLNEMIDMQTVRVAALNNRVPGPCWCSRSSGGVAPRPARAYLAILGRGVVTVAARRRARLRAAPRDVRPRPPDAGLCRCRTRRSSPARGDGAAARGRGPCTP